jgi:hypothetical protein
VLLFLLEQSLAPLVGTATKLSSSSIYPESARRDDVSNSVIRRIHFYLLHTPSVEDQPSTRKNLPKAEWKAIPHPEAKYPFIDIISPDDMEWDRLVRLQAIAGGRFGVLLSMPSEGVSFLGAWDWKRGLSLGVS